MQATSSCPAWLFFATPLLAVGELITPGIRPYLISNASLVFGPDAVSKSNLLLFLIRALAVFDDYDVVSSKTVLTGPQSPLREAILVIRPKDAHRLQVRWNTSRNRRRHLPSRDSMTGRDSQFLVDGTKQILRLKDARCVADSSYIRNLHISRSPGAPRANFVNYLPP